MKARRDYGPLYRELCLVRMKEVIAYIHDGWSVSSACARAGLRWDAAREHLIEDKDFVRAFNESLKKRGPSMFERWGLK